MLRRRSQLHAPGHVARRGACGRPFARAVAAWFVALGLAGAGCIDVAPFGTGTGDDTAGGLDTVAPDTGVPDTVIPDIADAADGADSAAPSDALDATDVADAPDVIVAPLGTPGETCAAAGAIAAAALPFVGSGTTATAADDYEPGACVGAPTQGGGTEDVVYRFTPATGGVYTFALPDAGPLRPGPAVISVVTACDGAAASCVGVSPDLVAGGALRVALEADVLYFVIIDGLYAGDTGPFTLTVSTPCQPACGGGCGPDGCGGSCGLCGGGTVCAQGGLCDLAEDVVGNTCAEPFAIPAAPYQHSDDSGYGSDAFAVGPGECPGVDPSAALGGGRRDHVFRFVPEATATYVFRLAAEFDAALTVLSACATADVGGVCLGGSDRGGAGVEEQVAVRLVAGHAAWVVVDGGARSGSGQQEGPYALTVSAPCFPDCSGRVCGDDGCFGSCGVCFAYEVCGEPGGWCELAAGNTCDDPFVVDATALPFGGVGDTASDAGDVFAWSGGACPGAAAAGGQGAPDQVWEFTAPERGVYTVRVVPGFDALLSVLAGACDAAEGGCVAASDAAGGGGAEEVLLDLAAGERRWLVVDGFAGGGNDRGPYSVSVSAPCVPACEGRACGPSGCGTSCGTCPVGAVCTADGRCEQPLGSGCEAPFVVDAGELPWSWAGTTADGATPTFATALDCGPNGTVVGAEGRDQVFAFTPVVSGVYTVALVAAFDAVLSLRVGCDAAVTQCVGAESLFGADEAVVAALEAGVAYAIVVDGFGAGEQGAYTLTVSAPCTPSCGTRVCGEDGCGLACGACVAPAACAPVGACVAPETLPGNVCANAFETGPVPFAGGGNTIYASDTLSLPQGACGGGYGTLGAGTPEQVWRFVAPSAGVYRVSVDAGFLVALYVLSGCGGGPSDSACVGVTAGAGHEELALPLLAGQEVRLVVDGLGAALAGSGPYTLRVGAACTPDCAGRSCGADGCGGQCGACAAGLSCDPAVGACVAPALVVGDVCENPGIVGALPAQILGTNAGYSADYAVPAEACAGVAGAWGAGASDVVYRFTPPAPGSYTVRLTADFDALLYVVRDCAAVASTCVAGSDALGVAPEALTLTVTTLDPLFIVVDGFSNVGDVSGPYTLEITSP